MRRGEGNERRYTQATDIANLFDHRVTRTYFNERGQKVEVIHAYGTRLAASEYFAYNQYDQLIRHIDPDGVTTRYAYNDKGQRIMTALDLKIEPGEEPDHIDDAVDRITRSKTELVLGEAGQGIRRTTNDNAFRES